MRRNRKSTNEGGIQKGRFLEAAFAVLAESNRPLATNEISSCALRLGLLRFTHGKTPARSMGSALYRSVLNDPASPFIRVSEPGPTRAVRNSVRWRLKPGIARKR
jgi:HB1, ASXL, restriction endonuclease HTH domain